MPEKPEKQQTREDVGRVNVINIKDNTVTINDHVYNVSDVMLDRFIRYHRVGAMVLVEVRLDGSIKSVVNQSRMD